MIKTISTDRAPSAIGTYSQAVEHGQVLYVSGQIPLVPETMALISDEIVDQINQVFENLSAILEAGGSSLNNVIKFTVYLTDLSDFPQINEIMAQRLSEPYPARVAVEVSALPRGAQVEIDAIASLS